MNDGDDVDAAMILTLLTINQSIGGSASWCTRYMFNDCCDAANDDSVNCSNGDLVLVVLLRFPKPISRLLSLSQPSLEATLQLLSY